jgi:hypothetical protein
MDGATVKVEKDSIYSFGNEVADHAPHQAPGSIIDGLAELVTFTVLNGKEDEIIERYCPVAADGNEPLGSSSSARLVDIVADLNLNNECEQIANGLVSELIEHVKIGEEFLAREDRTADILNIT